MVNKIKLRGEITPEELKKIEKSFGAKMGYNWVIKFNFPIKIYKAWVGNKK